MTKTHTSRQWITLRVIVFSCMAAMMFITSATAATADDSLNNVIHGKSLQTNDSFRWVYDNRDFEKDGSRNGFTNDNTTPDNLSIPPITWLFLSGLLCLLSIIRLNRE